MLAFVVLPAIGIVCVLVAIYRTLTGRDTDPYREAMERQRRGHAGW